MKIEIQNEIMATHQASITNEARTESEESNDSYSAFHSELSGVQSGALSGRDAYVDGSRVDGSRVDGSRVDGSRVDGRSMDGSRSREQLLPYLNLESKNDSLLVHLDSQNPQNSAVHEVVSDDFETKFGKELADFLKGMRAEAVKFEGNKVTLNLVQNYDLKADLGLFSRVKISKNASVEVSRNGEAICVTDSHGIKLDGIKDFPSVKIYRGADGQTDRASFKNLPGGFDLPPGSHARIDTLLKRMGR